MIKNIYKHYEEIVNYVIVGGLTTGVSLGSKWLLLFTILDASKQFELQLSVVISWIFAVLFAYFANRIFVFHSKTENYFKEFTAFVGGRILTLLMEMIIMWFFVTFLKLDSNTWIITITILCQVLIMILNYLISKFLIFIEKR